MKALAPQNNAHTRTHTHTKFEVKQDVVRHQINGKQKTSFDVRGCRKGRERVNCPLSKSLDRSIHLSFFPFLYSFFSLSLDCWFSTKRLYGTGCFEYSWPVSCLSVCRRSHRQGSSVEVSPKDGWLSDRSKSLFH